MTETTEPGPAAEPGVRSLRPAGSRGLYQQDVDLWAIIVGISKYQNDKWNLEWAHRDAEEVCRFIESPAGGKYREKHVSAFLDEEATTGKIQRALRSFLKKPGKDDVVLLYFACHGTPDPDRPGNIYLLTYDTDPDDIAGTALPMREINQPFQDGTLHADRVIILADTCHSAGIGRSMTRGVKDSADQMNRFLQSLSEAGKGIALLTSAERDETSREGKEWGEGHGVFTHFLLEGMRGAADGYPPGKRKKDGIVEVGELFEYVRDRVRKDTGDAQHPTIGAESYDRDLPIAWPGGVQAQQHCLLGRRLLDLGALLDDQGRTRSALRHFDQAIELSPSRLLDAYLGRGQAHYALGEYADAAADLEIAAELDESDAGAATEATLYLGMAYANLGRRYEAAAALKDFIASHPGDARVPWLGKAGDELVSPAVGVRRALLIGIGQYMDPNLVPTQTALNSCRMLHEALAGGCGFAEENIRDLLDADATRQGILAALAELKAGSGPADTVVVYFHGFAVQGPGPEFLWTHDALFDPQPVNAIGAQELHTLLNAIPARQKIVILEANASERFIALAREDAGYTLFLAAAPGSIPMDEEMDDGVQVVRYGLYAKYLAARLKEAPASITQGEFADAVAGAVQQARPDQQTLFIGSPDQLLFSQAAEPESPALFDLSLRRNFAAFSTEELQRRYRTIRQDLGDVPFPALHYRFGCAFLEKKAYIPALEALEIARGQSAAPDAEVYLQLGIAQLGLQRYGAARASFGAYLAAAPHDQDTLAEPLGLLDRITSERPSAVIAGIDRYPPVAGAGNDAAALQKVLAEDWAFSDVKLLLNEQATVEAIRGAFAEIAGAARSAPALFYFAGAGSVGEDGAPVIMALDETGSPAPLDLRTLAQQAAGAPTNLVTILDAGWARGVTLPWGASWGSRFSEPAYVDLRQPPLPPQGYGYGTVPAGSPPWKTPEWVEARGRVGATLQPLALGYATIYQVSIQAAFGAGRPDGTDAVVESEFPAPDGTSGELRVYGALTHALVTSLRYRGSGEELTYGRLASALESKLQWLQPYFAGPQLDFARRLFSNVVVEESIYAMIRRDILDRPIWEIIAILEAAIDEGSEDDPESRVDLGVALAAAGDVKESLKELGDAIDQSPDGYSSEAFYHRGRVQYESNGNLDQAVSDLYEAERGDPDNARIQYYLGQAIRARVARETEALADAEKALRAYLKSGAPLGRREEVQQFLDSRGVTGTGAGGPPIYPGTVALG